MAEAPAGPQDPPSPDGGRRAAGSRLCEELTHCTSFRRHLDGCKPDCSEARDFTSRHTAWARVAGLTAAICRCLPDSYTSCQSPQLRNAIMRNDASMLLLALKHRQKMGCVRMHPDVDALLDGTTGRALHLAVQSSSSHLVRVLIQNGATVNALDVHGRTPLHHAARRGSAAVVAALLEDPTMRLDDLDREGRSALRVAVVHGHWECAQLLLAAGASTDSLVSGAPLATGASALELSSLLHQAQHTLVACKVLWPPPSVRCCAVGFLPNESSSRELLATSMAPLHVEASEELAREIGEAESSFGDLFGKVIHTQRVLQHPLLTVSTDVGMMHYELHAPSRLLFMAITLPDLQQSAAFAFLTTLKQQFLARCPRGEGQQEGV